MCMIESMRRKSSFVIIICLFLWIGADVNNVSGWEVDALQRKLQEKGANWTAGETSLSHLSTEEFKQMLGLKFHRQIKTVPLTVRSSRTAIPYALAPSHDWRNYEGDNWITSVKNQQQCGSCYSFATLGTIETLIRMDQGDPDLEVDLAEQYLVSCGPSGNYGGFDYGGCTGNYTYYVADFLMSTGVPDEACFPYDANQIEGTEPSCENACVDVTSRVEKISGWSYIAPNATYYMPQPDQIKAVLVNKPVPCGMIVYEDLKSYAGGIYEPLDDPGNLELGGHLVCIIGYDDSQSCWIVKNSWGADWGESGFFRIAYSQTSESSLTLFGLESLELNYEETGTTTTTAPNSTTTTVLFTTTTTTIEPEDIPNLATCTPPGWSHPIIPSSQQGTNVYNSGIDVLYPSPKKTFIDFALCNENNSDVTESFFVTLYIDEVEAFTVEVEDVIDGKSCKSWMDEQFALSEGQHTIKIVVDVYDDVVEANEDDNILEMSFTWEAALWSGLYREMFGNDYTEDVHLLRNFRDERLLANKKGKIYVDMLYRNSLEIASLLLKDEDLRIHTASVIEQLIPELALLLNGEKVVISSQMVFVIEDLLDEFGTKASPRVKRAVKKVKKEIKKGEIFNQLGIKIE